MKRLNTIAAALAVLIPSAAMSATIDQSVSFGSNGNAFASDVFSTFTLYDGPETLTGVEFIYNYVSNGDITADLCAAFGDCEPSTAEISLVGSGAFAALNIADSENTGITNNTNAAQFGSFDLLLNGTLSAANLADFVGTGLVTGSIEAEGAYLSYAQPIDVSHSGSITLRYTTQVVPVPLPASAGLMLVSMVGLGAMARRRKS